jgi:hypothetical protein
VLLHYTTLLEIVIPSEARDPYSLQKLLGE